MTEALIFVAWIAMLLAIPVVPHVRYWLRRRRPVVKADQAIRAFADTYSADVELNERGHMTFTRDIAAGETIMVPAHRLETHRRHGGP